MAAGMGYKSHTRWPRISQRCPIGDRSEDMDGQSSDDITDLQTVPCHIAGMGLHIVLLEDKIVCYSRIERQGMRLRDFIHMALTYKSVPKSMYAK